ncbi:TetR/AcrR family transcriptional regulator [Paracoccus sp. 22332]|uniref:TetR/AcrR family transcriptional regulator n=1 Tax=Paracoccus sp. 22332 TaxID=3453913 RepID=UPI003F82F6A8
MARLSRAESQAVTRERLLAAAHDLFRTEGYAATSVDRIAAAAGYSKGAVYSNFEGKEAIFLAVLEAQGRTGLTPLVAAIETAPDVAAVIDLLVTWADDRSASGGWSLTILEHARLAGDGAASLRLQEEIIRRSWRELGEAICRRCRGVTAPPETLGALLHEIAYAPAMTFVSSPTAGELMRLAATRLLKEG